MNFSISVISPNSVDLFWLPPNPDYWNGIITNYTISIELHGPAINPNIGEQPFTTLISIPSRTHPLVNIPDPRAVRLPLQFESYEVNGLHEFHIYAFTVYMYNSAGRSTSSSIIIQELPATGR